MIVVLDPFEPLPPLVPPDAPEMSDVTMPFVALGVDGAVIVPPFAPLVEVVIVAACPLPPPPPVEEIFSLAFPFPATVVRPAPPAIPRLDSKLVVERLTELVPLEVAPATPPPPKPDEYMENVDAVPSAPARPLEVFVDCDAPPVPPAPTTTVSVPLK
jgi:hypothetical protein